MKLSIVVICLDGEPKERKYVQVTRRRFETEADALGYADGIALDRHPMVVTVPAVECDDDRYPIWDGDGRVLDVGSCFGHFYALSTACSNCRMSEECIRRTRKGA